jgi:hypothetical protein
MQCSHRLESSLLVGQFSAELPRRHWRLPAVVHIGSFLEFAFSDESVGIVVRAGSPANIVVYVKFNAGLAVVIQYELQTIAVDEDIIRTSLEFVGRDGLFD